MLVVIFGSPATADAEWRRVLDGTVAVFERLASARLEEKRVVH